MLLVHIRPNISAARVTRRTAGHKGSWCGAWRLGPRFGWSARGFCSRPFQGRAGILLLQLCHGVRVGLHGMQEAVRCRPAVLNISSFGSHEERGVLCKELEDGIQHGHDQGHGVGIAAALDPEGWVAPLQHCWAKALERVPLARREEPEELPLFVWAAQVLQRSQKQVLVSRQQGRGYVLRVLPLEHLASSPIQRKDQDRAGVVLPLADELGQALFRVEEVAPQVCLSLTGLCSETHGLELIPCHRGQPSGTL